MGNKQPAPAKQVMDDFPYNDQEQQSRDDGDWVWGKGNVQSQKDLPSDLRPPEDAAGDRTLRGMSLPDSSEFPTGENNDLPPHGTSESEEPQPSTSWNVEQGLFGEVGAAMESPDPTPQAEPVPVAIDPPPPLTGVPSGSDAPSSSAGQLPPEPAATQIPPASGTVPTGGPAPNSHGDARIVMVHRPDHGAPHDHSSVGSAQTPRAPPSTVAQDKVEFTIVPQPRPAETEVMVPVLTSPATMPDVYLNQPKGPEPGVTVVTIRRRDNSYYPAPATVPPPQDYQPQPVTAPTSLSSSLPTVQNETAGAWPGSYWQHVRINEDTALYETKNAGDTHVLPTANRYWHQDTTDNASGPLHDHLLSLRVQKGGVVNVGPTANVPQQDNFIEVRSGAGNTAPSPMKTQRRVTWGGTSVQGGERGKGGQRGMMRPRKQPSDSYDMYALKQEAKSSPGEHVTWKIRKNPSAVRNVYEERNGGFAVKSYMHGEEARPSVGQSYTYQDQTVKPNQSGRGHAYLVHEVLDNQGWRANHQTRLY